MRPAVKGSAGPPTSCKDSRRICRGQGPPDGCGQDVDGIRDRARCPRTGPVGCQAAPGRASLKAVPNKLGAIRRGRRIKVSGKSYDLCDVGSPGWL